MIASLLGYVVFGTIWILIRIQSFLKRQKKKEAAVSGGILAVSILLGALLIARVNLPSFILPIQSLLEPIGKFLLKQ